MGQKLLCISKEKIGTILYSNYLWTFFVRVRKSSTTFRVAYHSGSPPRMRGKAAIPCKLVHGVGITPAYAGKRQTTHSRKAGYWDHPRVCGEKSLNSMATKYDLGSPPRMRGKVVWLCLGLVVTGITPAYAGKSVTAQQDFIIDRDHPRVCGEKSRPKASSLSTKGSPPRMRGKGIYIDGVHAVPGITPAYAGKSSSRSSTRCSNRDHPRVCGEKFRRSL